MVDVRKKRHYALLWIALFAVIAVGRLVWLGVAGGQPELIVYSGRSADLIQPLLDQFTAESGIRVGVRYGQTAEMAATILEEGRRSPADLFFAQDAGALGALAGLGRLTPLPDSIVDKVEPRFRSPDGAWVGVSGRARVLIYDPGRVAASDLPDQLAELCESQWRSRVGWAPANGSFQAFVTAMRRTAGEDAARQWLSCLRDNDVREYANNTSIVLAVAAGEVDVGLVNHYYLHALQRTRGDAFRLQNHYPAEGVLVNVAGIGILDSSSRRDAAEQLAEFLLSESAQRYFADQVFEYPLAAGIEPHPALPPIPTLRTPELDLNRLSDLEQTLQLLKDVGLL